MSFSRTWIPNQHGAWAFLITPVIVGALAGGPNLWHAVLLLTWIAAYCLNFYSSLALKSRKPQRYQWQLAIYAGITIALGLPLAWHRREILQLLAFAVPAFAVQVWHVLQRNERAWLNDFVGVALAGVVGYGAFMLGSTTSDTARSHHAMLALLATCLYFGGTVIYVKTMIRERGSAVWMRISYAYHGLLVLLTMVLQAWVMALVALALLLRAIVIPRLRWTPKRIGLTEIAFTVAVALSGLLTLP